MNTLFLFGLFGGAEMVEGEPGVIIGPISMVLGGLVNFIYNMVASISTVGAFGISIIIVTIIFRSATLPFSIKQFRSSQKMAELQPEMKKIKDKYGDTKDPELKRKMHMEMQELQRKNGVNMFASCLPMLLQMPIFIAMIYVMRQAFLFVTPITDVYTMLANAIIALEWYAFEGAIMPIVWERVPQAMWPEYFPRVAEDLIRLINVMGADNWAHVFDSITLSINEGVAYVSAQGYAELVRHPAYANAAQLAEIQRLHNEMVSTVSFLGINLVAAPGLLNWPGALIPVTAAITTFFQSKLMMARSANADPTQQGTQKMMMYAMPVMMGFFTIGIAAGVGLYWIAGNVYAIVQQLIMNKYMKKPTPSVIDADAIADKKK